LVDKNFVGDIAAKMAALKPTFDKLEKEMHQEHHNG